MIMIYDKRQEYMKQYKIENREKHKEYMNQYNIDNRDKINELSKQYYIDNIDKIKQERAVKINCDCGGKYRIQHKATHYKTKKHQEYIKNISIL